MKKRALVVALALCVSLVFGLVGTGCSGGPLNQKTPEYNATITNTIITGTYDGSSVLVIDLEVTNNADYNLSSGTVQYDTTATLDGKTLASGYLSEDNPNALSLTTSIAPGETGPAQMVYELPATEGTVEVITVVDTTDYSGTEEILNETIDLSTIETIVSESEFEVTIDNVLVTDDGEGVNLLVIDATFANNSSETTSFLMAINAELFQNGLALKSGYLPYNHPSRDSDLSSNDYLDIQPGASIPVQLVYELNDTAEPVTIKLTDFASYDKAVILDKTIEIAGAAS